LTAGAAGTLGLALGAAWSNAALATPQQAAEAIKSLVKSTPQVGRVTIKLPEIAENGNTVPVTISVESPMTDKDYVKAIHLISEGNPAPHVASFNLTPALGKGQVELRMRLAGTQNVVAIAELSDGTVWSASREVKVTIGGCGG
jgi:sulfur-oxidizing protein SoxY